MASFNIRVEYKNSKGDAAAYDFVRPAPSRESAMFHAEARIRNEFTEVTATPKIRWRGQVAFVNCRPAEEIAG